jgi:hypothetical protein
VVLVRDSGSTDGSLNALNILTKSHSLVTLFEFHEYLKSGKLSEGSDDLDD